MSDNYTVQLSPLSAFAQRQQRNVSEYTKMCRGKLVFVGAGGGGGGAGGEAEGSCYALSASKAIFRAKT